MWIVFLKKFKNLFTTDDVIQNAKNQINDILKDLNINTSRNLTLIDERCNKLKALNAEADKKIKLLTSIEEKNAALESFHTEMKNNSSNTPKISKVADKYSSNMKKEPVKAVIEKEPVQNTLFDEAEKEVKTRFEVVSTGSASAPTVTYSENQIKSKKDWTVQALEMYENGFGIDEIAAKLERSNTEVQFFLTMNGKI